MPRGIPHSVFLGRVVRPGVDPQWTDEDQDKALAFEQEQATVCGGCGTRKAEWDKDRNAYVGQRHYCPGCEVLQQEGRMIKEGTEAYVRPYLTPRELVEDDDG